MAESLRSSNSMVDKHATDQRAMSHFVSGCKTHETSLPLRGGKALDAMMGSTIATTTVPTNSGKTGPTVASLGNWGNRLGGSIAGDAEILQMPHSMGTARSEIQVESAGRDSMLLGSWQEIDSLHTSIPILR